MPAKCSVPKCKGNYDNENKVSVFRFPKDNELCRMWLLAIKREDFIPTNNSRVCELHFRDSEIERSTKFTSESGDVLDVPLKVARLVKNAVPSKLLGSSKYLSKIEHPVRESPSSKRQKRDNSSLREAIAESLASAETYAEDQILRNLDDIVKKFSKKTLPLWNIIRSPNYVSFIHFKETPLPTVEHKVCITADMQLSIYFKDIQIKSIKLSRGKTVLPLILDTVNLLDEVLTSTIGLFDYMSGKKTINEKFTLVIDILDSISEELPENINSIRFLQEQIKLLNISKYAARYSWETVLFASLLHAISPHAYKFLRNANLLVLPSSSTVKKVCRNSLTDPRCEQSDDSFLKYVASKVHLLDAKDKFITLMVDEIHLKPYIDYKGGNLVGRAHNSDNSATSACVFMINSLLSSYKEVVHILPVKCLKAEELHHFIKKVIVGLEQIGFEVVVVVSDNHTVNRKAMSLFENPPKLLNRYQHPNDPSRPLFFAIDSVHILKNLRNNWINNKNQEIVYPDFKHEDILRTASFEALKEMHLKEANQLLKFGWTLSLKALYPSSIERQNVKLALQVINPHIVTALRELGPKLQLTNYSDTATYIEILCRWWDVANTKTPFKGIRYRNPYQEPIRKSSSHIFEFLVDMVSWLNRWSKLGGTKLTKETHVALKETTDVYIKIARYCLDVKKFDYFLPGQIQTDKLEERFGKYRYSSGSQYHVSLRQIFESENKFRLMSVVPLILKSKAYGDITITKEDMSHFIADPDPINIDFKIPISLKDIEGIEDGDIDHISENIWPSLAYIAGYASYSLIKNLKCDYCKVFLLQSDDEETNITNLISSNDRGGLSYPNGDVVIAAAHVYLTFEKLLQKESQFLQEKDHRKILTTMSINNINGLDLNLFLGHNCNKHKTENILYLILFRISNILMKNYSKKKNDIVTTKTMPVLKRVITINKQ